MRSVALLVCLCWFPVAAAAAGDEPSKNTAAAFAWFDTLGYPDVRDCPFIHVKNGKDFDAFLLGREPDGRPRVLSLDLQRQTLPLPPAARCEPADLARTADALAALLEQKGTYRESYLLGGTPHFSTLRAYGFVLGWACSRHGFDEPAARLHRLTARASHRDSSTTLLDPNEAGADECLAALQEDLGTLEMWRATLAVPTASRTASRDAFARVARLFPLGKQAAPARALADTLDTMIVEDRAHPAVGDPAQLPVEKQVAEWIFRLRDQTGHIYMSPGSCSIFPWRLGTPAGPPETPAEHLAVLGYAAVPALIDALASNRLSRAVDCNGREHFFSHRALTVGDCARQILENIAGRDFRPPGDPWRSLGDGDHLVQYRREVTVWWTSMQTRGEKETLMDEVAASSGSNALELGAKLLERYPDDAFEPLRRATQNSAPDDYVGSHAALVAMTASAPGVNLLPFLRAEMRVGLDHPEAFKKNSSKNTLDPVAQGRVAAAYALWNHGQQDEAFPALLAEWRRTPVGCEYGLSPFSLVYFLTRCGRAEAVDALGENFRQRTPELQGQVLGGLCLEGKDARPVSMHTFAHGGEWQVDYRVTPAAGADPAAWKRAVERLLTRELDNPAACEVGYPGWQQGGGAPNDVQVGDLAAYHLTLRWAGKYEFDLEQSLAQRIVQRQRCRSVWQSGRTP